MKKVIGYIISIIFIGLGIGGLYYLSHPKEYTDTNLVDISPETKYDWATLEKGMYVKLEANNQIGYYSYKKDDNGKDAVRIYLVYDYNQKSDSFHHVIGVMVNSDEFANWDSLESEKLVPGAFLKKTTVIDHVNKMPSTVIKSLKSSLVFDREEDASDIERMLVPYYIGPSVMNEDFAIYKIVAWIAIGIGGILLLVSIIGTFAIKD